MFFLDADSIENRPKEVEYEDDKRMENVSQFTLRA